MSLFFFLRYDSRKLIDVMYTELSDELINEYFNVKESLITHMYLTGHGRKAEWGAPRRG